MMADATLNQTPEFFDDPKDTNYDDATDDYTAPLSGLYRITHKNGITEEIELKAGDVIKIKLRDEL